MKKAFFCLVLILVCISGCKTVKNEQTDYIVLDGISLNNAGLTLRTDNLKTFIDPNTSTEAAEFYGVYNATIGNQRANMHGDGDITMLFINYTEDGLAMDYFPLLFFQAFLKNEEQNIQFNIEGTMFDPEELIPFTVYEDQQHIVFNITKFLPIDDFNTLIKKSEEKSVFYKYNWMNDVYQYIQTVDLFIIDRQ